MLSVGSKQFWSGSKPYTESPPSLDDELIGKQSLYDELLPHRSEISSEDDLVAEFLRANHNSDLKRRRSSSSTCGFPSSLWLKDAKKRKTGDTASGIAVGMAEMVIRTAAREIDTDEGTDYGP